MPLPHQIAALDTAFATDCAHRFIEFPIVLKKFFISLTRVYDISANADCCFVCVYVCSPIGAVRSSRIVVLFVFMYVRPFSLHL